MASYELALITTYALLVVGCFYFANTFSLRDLETAGVAKSKKAASSTFQFFFRSLGFFLVWQLIGACYAMSLAASAPASVLAGIQVTYIIFLWVFIGLLFFMFMDWIVYLLALIRDTRKVGRVNV